MSRPMLTDFVHRDPRRIVTKPADHLLAERDKAIEKLGPEWRGRPGATHEYRNSFGVLTKPDALTERTT